MHELLLALHGHPGGVVVRDEAPQCIRMAADLPFVHPGEAGLLARLCRLATLYANIDQFVRLGGERGLEGVRGGGVGGGGTSSGGPLPGLVDSSYGFD